MEKSEEQEKEVRQYTETIDTSDWRLCSDGIVVDGKGQIVARGFMKEGNTFYFPCTWVK